MDFLIVAGYILGFAVIIAALYAVIIKKNVPVGIVAGVFGVILILGAMVIKEKRDGEKNVKPTEAPGITSVPSETIEATEALKTTETPAATDGEKTAAPVQTPNPTDSEITEKPSETKTPTSAPESTKAPSKVTPIPAGDYGEVHYDSSTIVKPENWNGKTIYLTFDDGPSKTTARVLDNLAKYNVKCTFFQIGTQVGDYLPTVKRALDEGHSIGIHAYVHEYDVIYASVDAYVSDFNKCVNVFREKLAFNPTIFRFPGGTSNTTSKQYCKGIMTELSKLMPASGYNYCDWNVSPEDAMSRMTVDQIFEATKKEILSTSNNNKYVLMHDYGGMENTADAALKIVEWGLENGYAFDRLTPETPLYQHGVNN